MGTGYNMPDGVTERDIPGWNDIEVSINFTCELTDDCGDWTENDVTVDACGGHDVEATCPVCGELITQFYGEDPDDYIDRDDMYDREDYDFF
jgi:hypothetical protein